MANDFSGDAGFKAQWRMENGVLTLDSTGNGNTLTNTGSVQNDTSGQKEGDACALFNGSNRLSIADADTCTGFPFKTGDTNLTATFCFWVKGYSIPWKVFFAKDNSWWFGYSGYSYIPSLYYGSSTEHLFTGPVEINPSNWSHIALMVDVPNLLLKMLIYDSVTGITKSNIAVMEGSGVPAGSGTVYLGAHNGWGGDTSRVDEFVVVDRLLTPQEIFDIRTITFPTAHPDNVFSGDPDCVSRYRFNFPNIYADDVGANTLVAINGLAVPDYSLDNFIEGGSSIKFSTTDNGFQRADADLSTGFPFKYGDTIKKGSFTFGWFPESSVEDAIIAAKYDSSGGSYKKTIAVMPGSTGYNCKIIWGYSPGNVEEELDTDWAPTNNQQYYYGVVIDGIAKTVHVRVYGVTEAEIVCDVTLNATHELWIADAPLELGKASISAFNEARGLLDDLVIFKRCISSDEIDWIRQYIFPQVMAEVNESYSTSAADSIAGLPVMQEAASTTSAEVLVGLCQITEAVSFSHGDRVAVPDVIGEIVSGTYSGDPNKINWVGGLAQIPIIPGSVSMELTIARTGQSIVLHIEDNGAGALICTEIYGDGGVINYATGAFYFSFAALVVPEDRPVADYNISRGIIIEAVSSSVADKLEAPGIINESASASAADNLVVTDASQALVNEAVSTGQADLLNGLGQIGEAISTSAAKALDGAARINEAVSETVGEALASTAIIVEAVSLSVAESFVAPGVIQEAVSSSAAEGLAAEGLVGIISEAVSIGVAESLAGHGQVGEAVSVSTAEVLQGPGAIQEAASATIAEVLVGVVQIHKGVSLTQADNIGILGVVNEAVSTSAAEILTIISQGLNEAISFSIAENFRASQGLIHEGVSNTQAENFSSVGQIATAISLCGADEIEAWDIVHINEAVSVSTAEPLVVSQGVIDEAVSESQAERFKGSAALENLPFFSTVVLCVKAMEPITASLELEDLVFYAADDWRIVANV
jgi:hypothetical protein